MASIIRKILFLLFILIFAGALSVRIVDELTAPETDDADTTSSLDEVSLVSINDIHKPTTVIHRLGEVFRVSQLSLNSSVASTVQVVHVQPGDRVSEGQLLVSVDKTDLEQRLTRAAAAIQTLEDLYAIPTTTSFTQSELERLEATMQNAEAALERAKNDKDAVVKDTQEKINAADADVTKAREELIDLENTRDQNLDSALTAMLTDMQEAIGVSQTAMITIADMQATYFANSEVQANEIAQKKSDAMFALFGLADAGRSPRSVIQTAHGGIKEQVTNELASSDHDADMVRALGLGTLDGIQKTMITLQAVSTSSQNRTDITQSEKNTITQLTDQLTDMQNNLAVSIESLQTLQQSQNQLVVRAEESVLATEQLLNYVKQSVNQSLAVTDAMVDLQQNVYDAAKRVYDAAKIGETQVQKIPAGDKRALENARASYDRIQSMYDQADIVAPADGTISAVNVSNGDAVAVGDVLVQLVNTEGLEVKTHITVDEKELVSLGQYARIDNTYDGVITGIASDIDPVSKKIAVTVLVHGARDMLTPQEFVYVDIAPMSSFGDDETMVNLHSLYITQTGTFIFSVNDKNSIEAHEVTVEDVTESLATITSNSTLPTDIIADVRGLDIGEEVRIVK